MSGSQRIVRRVGVLSVVIIWLGAASTVSAATLFANVDMAGALVSGSPGASSVWLGTGQYEVTFASDVSQCAYVATTANAYTQALQAYTAGGHISGNGVYVETKNQGGGLTDGPFHLVVVCDGPKLNFAVVGYTSNLVRSTAGAILAHPGTGRYTVTFLTSVKACAYLATVADPGSALVFNPSGVYTGSGANSKTVYIETKNPGGGLQDGIPFHLAVICATAPKTHVLVVNSSGLAVRGAALTSSFKSATGEYRLVTSVNINPDCATVATRGSVDKAVPFAPATVEIVPGPAPNTIGVQVRDLLLFGGNLANAAFHAGTVCR